MRNLFVSRASGSIIRITKTDKSYAYIQVLHPTASAWAMPRADYDTKFIYEYRPAELEDFDKLQKNDKPWELPANAPDDIKDWPKRNTIFPR